MVRIVGISDIHHAYDMDTRFIIDDIINNISDIDIVVTHGDLVHQPLQPTANPHQYTFDPERVYDDLGVIIDKIKTIPADEFYYTPGNHDPWFIYRKMFGRTYYIVEKDTFILAVLDSTINYWFGAFPWKQVQELIDLITSKSKPAIIFAHHPPVKIYSGDSTDLWKRHFIYWIARNGEVVLDALDALGQKIVFLTGHDFGITSADHVTYGSNTTVACKRHTWKWDTTNNKPIAAGDTWVIDIDETNRTINVQVFQHDALTISSLLSITY